MDAEADRLEALPDRADPAEAAPARPAVRPTPGRAARNAGKSRRAFWLKQLHQWHWISSAIGLLSLLLFSVTGITLNHAGRIEGRPQVSTREARLPPDRLALLAEGEGAGRRPLPGAVAGWISAEIGVSVAGREGDWSAREVYVSLPRPGGDAWLTVDRRTGEVLYERTDRGWISYLNDLHKGRNTGLSWALFIDAAAAACLISALTGLLLLQLHARHRPLTWPMVGLGLAVPLLIAALFIH